MSILEQIRQAGVVGCGGAGFPTHLKLKAGVEYLIVNGAECEPLLRTDRYIMLHHAPQLVKAILALKEELSISRCVIAVKAHYRQEIEALEQAIGSSPVEIHQLGSFYPAGDEQTIVHEVTGRVVPPGGLPLAAGAVVDNIATIYAISQAMEGIPFTQKILTVTGEVAHPVVLSVPVGTSFRACLELAGGPLTHRYCVVSGGPMMGRTLTKEETEEAFVTKTTSGILVLPEEGPQGRARAVDLTRMLSRTSSACIQCTSCTQLCLHPVHQLHPALPPAYAGPSPAAPPDYAEDGHDLGSFHPFAGPGHSECPALLRVRRLRTVRLPHGAVPPEDQRPAQAGAGPGGGAPVLSSGDPGNAHRPAAGRRHGGADPRQHGRPGHPGGRADRDHKGMRYKP